MPFTEEQLEYGAYHAIDHYLRNNPVDQVNIDHPLLHKLTEGKLNWGGGLQYVVENIRVSNDSNFQSYFGDSQVTYNRRRTLGQAKFTWGSFHDGFGLNEDELAQNGITMTDDRSNVPTKAERVQLVNLLSENLEALRLGFQENFDLMLHRDGTQSATDIAGLDLLVSVDAGTGQTVGGIVDNVQTLWVNHKQVDIVTSSGDLLVTAMENAWRECIRRSKSTPNFILAGEDFIDAYRAAASTAIGRRVHVGDGSGNMKATNLDAGIGSGVRTGLYFKNVEIMWDPTFEQLDTADSPTEEWVKRCYFLNTKFIKLRPIEGHWMVKRKPPRVYDRYVHYWAMTTKASMTIGKRNAQAVLHIA